MLVIERDKVRGILDRHVEPAAVCKSGETVIFQTRDCYDDSVTSPERPLGDREDPMENPATGPLYVEGAQVGDVLKVEILNIVSRSWGVMRSSPVAGVFREDFDSRMARIFEFQDGKTVFDNRLTLDLDTMIGVIGTAPAGEGVTTDTPGEHGGNMDCRKIVKGSVLYLPVCVPGALLSIGDLHGLMGDGEVMICGLETGGEVTVRVTAVKGSGLPTPFLYCRGDVMTVQSARTLDEAGDMAAKAMKDFVKEAAGKDDFEAGMLMSLLSNMAVCQVVDPLKTVRVEFPLRVLEAYGYHLP
ncbi:MAG: acetamidase [Hungatella sp.]|nr:acetamidase [Hungatella sp.]